MSLSSAIINTLTYADIFDYPLRVGEIHRFLIHNRPISLTSVCQQLNTLISSSRVGESQNFYYLPNRKKIVSLRLSRERISREKIARSRGVGQWLRLFPTLKAVFITGALALKNSQKTDDIDLMVIVKSGWLWTTRLLVNLLLDIAKVRRKPKSRQVTNKICLNLWLDDTHLSLLSPSRNLYVAHEIAQTKPLWDRHHAYQRFLSANRWVKDYLPNTNFPKGKSLQPKTYNRKPHFVELLAYQIQLKYMQSRRTRETISLHSAFFHPRNTAQQVLKKYHQKLRHFKLK